MSAEWKVRFSICIAPVAIQAFTKLMLSFDVLKATNCTIQEVDNIDKVPRWDEILSFNKVFNSLSLCFVYLVLFYNPF